MARNNAKLLIPIDARPEGGTYPGATVVRRGTEVPKDIQIPPFDDLDAKLDSPRFPFYSSVGHDDGQLVVNLREGQKGFRVEDLDAVATVAKKWVRTQTDYGTGPAEIVW